MIFECLLGQEWNSYAQGDNTMKYENIFINSSKVMLVQKDHPEYDYKSVTVFQIFKKISSNTVNEKWSNKSLSVLKGEKHCHKENNVTEKKSDEGDKKQLWRRNKSNSTFFFTNLQSGKVLTVLPNGTFITLCQSQFVSNDVI